MDFKILCKSRYSVRAYLSTPVEREKIDYVLRCAQLAPSATNGQPWRLYVVTNEEVKAQIQESYNRDWFRTAPMYIVACKNSDETWKRSATDGKDFGDVDMGILGEHISLAAEAIGLGTCWVCNFIPEKLHEALKIEQPLEAIAIFPLGYVDEENSVTPQKKRKMVSDVTTWID